ncbi:MAG: phosphatidylserine decarboxylase [Gammaproteobacteria bacterium]|nr:phosphatidylserine decarboxylase [Gammaproteobacteria bacterium]
MNVTFHSLLPKKLLSATMYRLARIQQPTFKNIAIRSFMAATGANLNDAQRKNYRDYDSLLDFFTRELAPKARPITQSENNIACPVDGRVAHVGDIKNGQIFQIKGHSYSLQDLVGEDYAPEYETGQATTIYLAPFDYHRIHSPLSGKLKRARYIPGELNSVSITLLDKISGLFAKNERLVLEFEDNRGNTFLMVLVGAVNVGSIETVFHGEICPNDFSESLDLPAKDETIEKGAEIGRFNLGSTIIFITKPNQVVWNLSDGQKTKMGEKIGQIKERIDG